MHGLKRSSSCFRRAIKVGCACVSQRENVSSGLGSKFEYVGTCVGQRVGLPPIFFLSFLFFMCTCVSDSAQTCRGGYFKGSTSLAVISKCSTVSVIFPCTPLLCSVYLPSDIQSSLDSTPFSIKVPKQVECNILCRFSKLLPLFVLQGWQWSTEEKDPFLFLCLFLCVVLAATNLIHVILKYCQYHF